MPEPLPTARFFVHGKAAPQGSHTAIVRGGKAVVIPSSSTVGRQAHQNWRHAVGLQAATCRSDMGVRYSDCVAVRLVFCFAPTKARPYEAFKKSKPDLDKLIRATLDGLTAGGIIVDDSLVVRVTAEKCYADVIGCEIEISDMSVEDGIVSEARRLRAKEEREARARGER